jgi:hypothetical protein
MNRQELSHEVDPVHYIYDMRMPMVHTVEPLAGPLSGNTRLTITGLRFPPTDDDKDFVTPRCMFGPNLFTIATRISATKLTCLSPRACLWRISTGGVGMLPEPVRENEIAAGPPAAGTPCVFPFKWPPTNTGKSRTECLTIIPSTGSGSRTRTAQETVDFDAALTFFGEEGTIPSEPFCATSNNFVFDKQWGVCKCDPQDIGPIQFAMTFNLIFRITPSDEASKHFIYYNDMKVLPPKENGLFPVSGTSDSPTRLRITGSNFSDAGHTIRCFFADSSGINLTTLASPLSDTLLTCTTPSKPDEMGFSIFVSITGNMQQFSDRIAFMYYLSPVITRIQPTDDTVSLLAKGLIDKSYTAKYTMPAGPTKGGTKVTIEGKRILDKSRCPILPHTGLVETQLGLQSCGSGTTCPTQMQCQFPFKYRPQGTSTVQTFDACTDVDRRLKLGSLAASGATWCMVNFLKPGNTDFEQDFDGNTIFEKSYMECDCNNPVYTRLDKVACGVIEKARFPAYVEVCPSENQQLTQVTKVECRFGHKFVTAQFKASGGNGTDTIVCEAPQYDYSVRVPISITLNRVDYTKVEKVSNCLRGTGEPCTWFQYLAPKPEVLPAITGDFGVATISPTFDLIRINFNVPTDMGGQPERQAALYGATLESSGCIRYFTTATILQLGSNTMPVCKWSVAQDALVITVGEQPSFNFDTTLELTTLAGMQVQSIHVSRLPLVLMPTTPDWSDEYDGATQVAQNNPQNRVRDGFITNRELEAKGLDPIATDGTAQEINAELGLELLPQLSYLFEPSGSCPKDPKEQASQAKCPLRFKILRPTAIDRPYVKIDGLPTQDSCATNTIFDGRRSVGSLGRDFIRADWIAISAPPSVKKTTWDRVQNQLKDSFDGALLQAEIVCKNDETKTSDSQLDTATRRNDILCSSLSAGTYRVGLNATNWVGLMGSETFSWVRVDMAVGNVRVVGDANQVITKNQMLKLNGMAQPSECVAPGQKVEMSFRWTISAPQLPAAEEQALITAYETSSFVKDKVDLQIPAFTLPFHTNQQYTFTLHLNHTYQSKSVVTTAQTNVKINQAPLVARNTGGSGTLSKTQDFELSGERSHDLNVPNTQWTSVGLMMCWGCLAGTCSGLPCTGVKGDIACHMGSVPQLPNTPFERAQGPNWFVPKEAIVLNAEYHITLTVAAESDLAVLFPRTNNAGVDPCLQLEAAIQDDLIRYDRDTVLITTPANPGLPPLASISPMLKEKYNTHTSLRLSGMPTSVTSLCSLPGLLLCLF